MINFKYLEDGWSRSPPDVLTLLLCFYTGKETPGFCAAMPRTPSAPVETAFDGSFLERYRSALCINSTIHDGAVLIGRAQPSDGYLIRGWSIRLYPPPASVNLVPNRGSAFNSCLEMSCVPTVDRLYLFSAGRLIRFVSGEWATVI
jgi:hypothetical protein